MKVTDGGSSGAPYDKYEHDFAAGGSCLVPASVNGVPTYSQYPITAGNLTVFS